MNQTQKTILNKRLETTIAKLYHNATPAWPTFQDDEEFKLFHEWLDLEVEFAFQDMELWIGKEFIERFGEVHSYGRSGRTVAPKDLIRHGGGSRFSLTDENLEEWSVADKTEAIDMIEKFNSFVHEWNKDVPRRFQEYVENNLEDVAQLSNN